MWSAAVWYCYCCYWWVVLLEHTCNPGSFHSLCSVPQVCLWTCLFLHGRALPGHASTWQRAGPGHWCHHWLDLLDLCHLYQHVPKADTVSISLLLTPTRMRRCVLHQDFFPVVSVLWDLVLSSIVKGVPTPKPLATCAALTLSSLCSCVSLL